MNTYIAILRGINVGGKRMIKMEALRQMFSDLGFQNATSYIQSGNVVFNYKEEDTNNLASLIEREILETFSFEAPVIVITRDELKQLISINPLVQEKDKNIDFLHVTFLSEKPKEELTNTLNDMHFQEDEFHVIEKAIYLFCPNSYSNSKLTNGFFEKKLKTTATTRNWKTTNELLNIAVKISNA